MHVGIRADGGPEIGYGHLMRTGALATELLDRDATLNIATTTPTPAREVFPPAVDVIELPSRADPDPFIEWLDTAKPDIVVTDAYPVDTNYQQAVRDRVPLVVLQDDARHAVCADVFTNGNLYGPELDYEFVGQPPKQCLVADYVLLRPEIQARAAGEPPWRGSPERAIIMMGGSDLAELTPTVVRAFDGFDLTVDAIVGPGCSQTQEQAVRTAASESSTTVEVSRDPVDLVDRFHQILALFSPLAEKTLLVLAARADVIEAHPRLLVAMAALVDRLQKPAGGFCKSRGPSGVLRKGPGYAV